MPTGFIYTITTLTKEYVQEAFCRVPTQYGDRIYFGACKEPMRRKMKPGDYVFGLSASKPQPRRIVFVGHIDERITFRDAYDRFQDLRGPEGPIYVRPIRGSGGFPNCSYEHIQGAGHEDGWEKDLKTQDLDAFFIFSLANDCIGRWLGEYGPEVEEEMLTFLRTCSVHGEVGKLSENNLDGTIRNPIARGGLYRGLHLETDEPEQLIALCQIRMAGKRKCLDRVPIPSRQSVNRGSCGSRRQRVCI